MCDTTSKCFECNKYIKPFEFIIGKCKCMNHYCYTHKIPEKHNCQFNFKEKYAVYLTSNMPIVQKSKLDKL